MRPEGAAFGLAVDWPAPANVRAVMSTRGGGVSQGVYASLNLGAQVGDDAVAVAQNRRLLERALGAPACWLQQVHGRSVVHAAAFTDAPAPRADASWTDVPGVACVVQAADCLPILFAAANGRAVGAAHAGWRGLAAGVAPATLEAVAAAAACPVRDVIVWLGPCIGPAQFEVGAEVRDAFGGDDRFFVPRSHSHAYPDGHPRWLADLAGLARLQLQRAGAIAVSGGVWCTVAEASNFFSFRRDGVTGRLAAGVCLVG